jgi:hypothetical protein
MGVGDHLNDTDSTSGSSSMARVERAPFALNMPSYIGSGDLYNESFSDPRSGYWTVAVPGTERGADATWAALPEGTRKQISALAKAYHPNATGESLWGKAVTGAAEMSKIGQPTTAFEWLSSYSQDLDMGEAAGGRSGSGRGGYTGPTSSTTFMDERDVDRTANALALELIGRPLSQKELSKVTKRLRSEEAANPTISTPGVGSSVTQSGLSAEGRADVLREVISENPEFQQYQVDHTVLDAMLAGLNKREQMVNGG